MPTPKPKAVVQDLAAEIEFITNCDDEDVAALAIAYILAARTPEWQAVETMGEARNIALHIGQMAAMMTGFCVEIRED